MAATPAKKSIRIVSKSDAPLDVLTLSLMKKVKGRGIIIQGLNDSISANLKLIETLILADRENKALHTLYLQSLYNLGRDKLVASWQEWDGSFEKLRPIICSDMFRISFVGKDDDKIRVHLTPEAAADIKKTYGDKMNFEMWP